MARNEDARTRLEAAIAAFERVIDLDPSDSYAAYPAVARTYLELLQHEHRRGRSIEIIVPEALRLVERAIVLNATDAALHRLRAAMRLTQAESVIAEGHTANRVLDAVHEDLRHALQGSTNDAEAHRLLAAMHRLRAESMAKQGGDPLLEIAAAQADYERAVAIDAHNPENDVEAVSLLLARARFADAKHEKKRMARAALAIVDKAMQRAPLTASTLHLLKSEAERLAGRTISAPRP
jgi:tetratricopeptide (TPR) repeat protein